MPRRVSAALLALQNQPHALYRFFDRSDVLLYVGITVDLPTRIKNHNKGKPWWTQVHHITLEQFDTRQEALDAEKKAIREEGPLHNGQHNPHVLAEPTPAPHDIDSAWIAECWPKVRPHIRDQVEVPAHSAGRHELADSLLSKFTPDEQLRYLDLGRERGECDGEDELDGPEATVRAVHAAIHDIQTDVALLTMAAQELLDVLPVEQVQSAFERAQDEPTDVRVLAAALAALAQQMVDAGAPEKPAIALQGGGA